VVVFGENFFGEVFDVDILAEEVVVEVFIPYFNDVVASDDFDVGFDLGVFYEGFG
jgi:hypothetical protein